MRGNQKLPRGSYFYVQIGPKFYGGKAPEKVAVREAAPVARQRITIKTRITRYSTPWARQSNKKDDPSKIPVSGLKTKEEPRVIFTGRAHSFLVDTLEEAKPFRIRSKADAICDELAKEYASLGVVPVVGIVSKGDSK